MVNQKNISNLMSFESLKFSYCAIAFPFTFFYDTYDLFFVNFVVSTVFSYTVLREKLARVTGRRLTAVLVQSHSTS